MNVEQQVDLIVCVSNVQAALVFASRASMAVVLRALHVEEAKPLPRLDLVRGLKVELRRKERAAAAAPKERA